MYKRTHKARRAAQLPRLSPEQIARNATRDARDLDCGRHPRHLRVHLEVYRQARAWHLQHPRASKSAQLAAYHAILRALMRGVRYVRFPGANRTAIPRAPREPRAGKHPRAAAQAVVELFAWKLLERGRGRRPTASAQDRMYDVLFKKYMDRHRAAARRRTNV
jgi:hypothetical protein